MFSGKYTYTLEIVLVMSDLQNVLLSSQYLKGPDSLSLFPHTYLRITEKLHLNYIFYFVSDFKAGEWDLHVFISCFSLTTNRCVYVKCMIVETNQERISFFFNSHIKYFNFKRITFTFSIKLQSFYFLCIQFFFKFSLKHFYFVYITRINCGGWWSGVI